MNKKTYPRRLASFTLGSILTVTIHTATAQDGNTSFGTGAGASITTGDFNSFFGEGAGNLYRSGSNSTLLGYHAGNLLAHESDNTFVGAFTGSLMTGGNDNVFIGMRAGMNNAGTDGVFIGADAGISNTTGGDNTFVGEEAGKTNTTGKSNTFIGEDAGFNNTNADGNTAVGSSALRSNTTSYGNTGLGYDALYDNTTGLKNTGLGWGAGFDIGTGSLNLMVGAMAGHNTEYANFNTFVGAYAGAENNRSNNTTNAGRNTYVGTFAGEFNREGSNNVVIGALADMLDNTNATDAGTIANALAGTTTLSSVFPDSFATPGTFDDDVSQVVNIGALGNVIGDDAVGIGFRNRSNGRRGIALGSGAQSNHAEAIAIGYQATTHGNNIAVIGNATTASIDPGTDGVTALGSSTYRYASAHAKTFNATADSATAATMDFSADAGAQDDDKWRVQAADSGAFSISSFATGAYLDLLSVANSGDVTIAGDINVNSDRRLKQDIEGIGGALAVIEKVEGKTYQWKPELGRDERTHYGFIAQEVEAALPELVTTRESDGIKSVNYQGFVPILVNAVGELKEQNDTQREQIDLLKKQLALQQQLLEKLTAAQ